MTSAFDRRIQAARAAKGRAAVAEALASAHAAIAEGGRRTALVDLCELAGLLDELLQDSEQARRCLDEALERAVDAGDFVSVAAAHAERPGGKRAAEALVKQALDLARASRAGPDSELDVHGFWGIAGLQCYTLGDPAGARATLTTGLELCRSVDEVLTIARACHDVLSNGMDYRRAMDSAYGLATDSPHWVAIAEVVFDLADSEERGRLQQERPAIRHALERGLSLASGDGERAAVATGFRALLDDGERADGICASGRPAGEIIQPLWILQGWPPDPARLLDLLRARVDGRMLASIAEADYGSDRARHLSALVAIGETGLVPYPLPWHPREVLELVRWDEGDDIDHARRAFVCAVLCIDAAGPEYSDGTGQTLAIALESCLVLGREFVEAYVDLTAALVQGQEDHDERALFGLFALLLAQAWIDPSDPRLRQVVSRLETLEAEHSANGYECPEDGWLLGTTFFNQRHSLWRELSARILGGERAAGFEHLDRVHARIAVAVGAEVPPPKTSSRRQ